MYPERIVCLTEEPTETLYAIGEERRIVGISGFTVRPARARKEKPKVSAFTSAKIDEILKLEPDLAIGFSDIQADIARDLIKAGVEVWISNHRSVDGILGYIRRLSAMVGRADAGEAYAQRAEAHIAAVRAAAAALPRRPKVYFEEWDDPLIGRKMPLHSVAYVYYSCSYVGHSDALTVAKHRQGMSPVSGASARAYDACTKAHKSAGFLPRPGASHQR